jgi:hypothetical protein
MINIANEWGPTNSTVWRDANISAIAKMRAAGYLAPLVIDSGGYGQDQGDFLSYSAAVFSSDPQKNIVFSLHLYGQTNSYSASISTIQKGNPTIVHINTVSTCHPLNPSFCPPTATNSWIHASSYTLSGVQGMTQVNGDQRSTQNAVGGTSGAWTVTLNVDSTNWGTYAGGGTIVNDDNYGVQIEKLGNLARTTGAAYIVGEFGPGRNIGPSPTMTTPIEIVSAAEANGVGWIGWAFDDDPSSFGMTKVIGTYNVSSDLTIFGQQIVEGCLNPSAASGCGGGSTPQYSGQGLLQLGRPASIF